MELKLIIILGVILVLATTVATTGASVSQAKALYPKQLTTTPTGGMGYTKPPTVTPHHSIQTQPGKASQSHGVIHSRQFGKTKPPTVIIKHDLGPNVNPFFWVWHK